MSATNDGGPAFPVPGTEFNERYPGMSLRDWFAGMALQHIPVLLHANLVNRSCENIAEWSYKVADAMLAARGQSELEKEPESEWSEWIEWGGGERPVHEEVLVWVRLRDGLEGCYDKARSWTWNHRGHDGDIIAYRFRKGGSK